MIFLRWDGAPRSDPLVHWRGKIWRFFYLWLFLRTCWINFCQISMHHFYYDFLQDMKINYVCITVEKKPLCNWPFLFRVIFPGISSNSCGFFLQIINLYFRSYNAKKVLWLSHSKLWFQFWKSDHAWLYMPFLIFFLTFF